MTPEEYLQRVRALIPAIRERALPAERLRRLPEETFAEFQEAGLFRCLQPKRYGGFELDPGTLYQAVMEIGAVCGSTAWILGVIGIHNWHLALFASQAQDDVWGKDTGIQVSTSLAPTGTVTRVDGGFRLIPRRFHLELRTLGTAEQEKPHDALCVHRLARVRDHDVARIA